MGYYNPLLSYGEEQILKDAKSVGVNGFIVVDLPPEEAVRFRNYCTKGGLSYVPLIAPATSEARMKFLCSIADSFIYVVSRMGVTGVNGRLNTKLPELVEKVIPGQMEHQPRLDSASALGKTLSMLAVSQRELSLVARL